MKTYIAFGVVLVAILAALYLTFADTEALPVAASSVQPSTEPVQSFSGFGK